MARFDFRASDHNWSVGFLMEGQPLLMESSLMNEPIAHADSARAVRIKPIPKKVTRKIRRSPAGPYSS